MIITKTPFRMSFFGGGTDMPEYFNQYGGSVLSTTFDKYCYVTVRHLPRFFDYTTELIYSKIEQVNQIDDIVHPLVRNAMKYLDMHELRINYEADLPARSGLGTSSSFAVGMLQAFYALKGKYADKRKLADDAIFVERTLCGEAGGWQDQIAASFGGLNRIDFDSNGYRVTPIVISPQKKQELNQRLMLFFTGFTHHSSEVQQAAGGINAKKVMRLQEMRSLVTKAEQILVENENLDEFGHLLHYSWELKKGSSSVISNDAIDKLYDRGIKAGALGGKLLGAGGGGFLLFYVPKDKRECVQSALGDLLYVPFEFEGDGTQILYYKAEDNYDVEGCKEDRCLHSSLENRIIGV